MFTLKERADDAYIIAEVGQNHQGDFEIAKKYIREFSGLGANAIKFQTRDNRYLFSEAAYHREYNSENSFGITYGEHRENLELTIEQLHKLKMLCHDLGVDFISTPFDEPSLASLVDVGVDAIKIASFDVGNLPFINRISKCGLPVIMSVGGAQVDQIRDSVALLEANCNEIAVLHCVSEYPCNYDNLGLDNIELLANTFPNVVVGLSDHFNGIVSGPVAYMKGARVFEKHVTFNRAWKGTDHSFSLEHHGFKNFVRDIRRVPKMMKPKDDCDLGLEPVFKKLGKSIIAAIDIKEGEIFSLDNLSGRIFEHQYIPVREANRLIGGFASKTYRKGDPIDFCDVSRGFDQ